MVAEDEQVLLIVSCVDGVPRGLVVMLTAMSEMKASLPVRPPRKLLPTPCTTHTDSEMKYKLKLILIFAIAVINSRTSPMLSIH